MMNLACFEWAVLTQAPQYSTFTLQARMKDRVINFLTTQNLHFEHCQPTGRPCAKYAIHILMFEELSVLEQKVKQDGHQAFSTIINPVLPGASSTAPRVINW